VAKLPLANVFEGYLGVLPTAACGIYARVELPGGADTCLITELPSGADACLITDGAAAGAGSPDGAAAGAGSPGSGDQAKAPDACLPTGCASAAKSEKVGVCPEAGEVAKVAETCLTTGEAAAESPEASEAAKAPGDCLAKGETAGAIPEAGETAGANREDAGELPAEPRTGVHVGLCLVGVWVVGERRVIAPPHDRDGVDDLGIAGDTDEPKYGGTAADTPRGGPVGDKPYCTFGSRCCLAGGD